MMLTDCKIELQGKSNDVVRVMHILHERKPYYSGEYLHDIVYEDDTLLMINKLPGMVVHPGHGNYTGTLVHALAYHFDNLPMNSSERPGLVHRSIKILHN
jgi:23S rRNA pseudouridine1911/1915/1917 synthase